MRKFVYSRGDCNLQTRKSWFTGLLIAVIAVSLFMTIGASSAAGESVADTSSCYITMGDGVKLAADIHLPKELASGEKVPTLLVQTRYRRSTYDPLSGAIVSMLTELDEFFLQNGYAVVNVDVRGTGASFGSRKIEYGPVEVMDGYAVVEWIVQQPWSNGKVGAYGTSYAGTTSEFLLANQHPAVKAVAVGWSDFDTWRSPARPYGMFMDSFIGTWAFYVGLMDNNVVEMLGASVRPVDEDVDGSMLAAAVAGHAENVDVYEMANQPVYRDEKVPPAFLYSFQDIGSLHWKAAIEASNVPMLVLASWMDAGTQDGALVRYLNYTNPQKLVILASSHGGGYHASPYTVSDTPIPPVPSVEEQFQLRLDFFDHYLKGAENGVEDWPGIRYFNMGEEAMKEAEAFPPPGTTNERFYLRENFSLSSCKPKKRKGADQYLVDFSVTTGPANRWMTQMGEPVLNLDDRGAMDAKMLTYTTEPLKEDVQITGWPVVSLKVAADADDAALFVYLEDVDENGRSRYVTEGGLRAIHRKVTTDPDLPVTYTPDHSFAQADGMPVVPGEKMQLDFKLWPTSALIKKGHRIRLAIAGGDAGNFNQVPEGYTPTLTVDRNKVSMSYIDLPVVKETPDPPNCYVGSTKE
jgi:putative CocE/NonD family hydrolase